MASWDRLLICIGALFGGREKTVAYWVEADLSTLVDSTVAIYLQLTRGFDHADTVLYWTPTGNDWRHCSLTVYYCWGYFFGRFLLLMVMLELPTWDSSCPFNTNPGIYHIKLYSMVLSFWNVYCTELKGDCTCSVYCSTLIVQYSTKKEQRTAFWVLYTLAS